MILHLDQKIINLNNKTNIVEKTKKIIIKINKYNYY